MRMTNHKPATPLSAQSRTAPDLQDPLCLTSPGQTTRLPAVPVDAVDPARIFCTLPHGLPHVLEVAYSRLCGCHVST
jgi:hypothetical protein